MRVVRRAMRCFVEKFIENYKARRISNNDNKFSILFFHLTSFLLPLFIELLLPSSSHLLSLIVQAESKCINIISGIFLYYRIFDNTTKYQ